MVACAQDNGMPDKNKLQWGISTSLDYTNRILTNKSNDPTFDGFIDLHNKEEVGSFGYSMGVDLHLPLGKRTTVSSGLCFSRLGYQTRKRYDLHWPDEVKDGEYAPDTTRNDEDQLFYRYYYLGVPISLRIYLNESTPWFVSAGIATNFFLKATSTYIYTLNGETDISTMTFKEDIASINIIPEIGFGRKFQMSKHLQLQVAPVFRFGCIPIYADLIANNTWSAGLTMHLVFGA